VDFAVFYRAKFTSGDEEISSTKGIVSESDGMRRPVSGRDAIRSQVIDALEAQEIKEIGNEKG
jgi:hypothetical protein